MSWIETILSQMEARIRYIIEEKTSRDGFPHSLRRQLEGELIYALKSNAHHPLDQDQKTNLPNTAPDQYTLLLPEGAAQVLLTHPIELDRLACKLESNAAQAGIRFNSAPVLRVVSDPHRSTIIIQTGYNQTGMQDSSTFRLEGSSTCLSQPIVEKLPNSFLIVNGLTTFPITAPVINIGRDPSNQLKLDNPKISRQHAQLRFIQGRFVIFDLDSLAGTFVNGVAVSNRALNPGDVIQLAGIPIVYGQESTPKDSQTQELPIDQPPPEVL